MDSDKADHRCGDDDCHGHVWFREDLCDKEFIKKWVEPEGLRQWKDYVLV